MNPPIKSAKWQIVHSSIVCQQIARVALSADGERAVDRDRQQPEQSRLDCIADGATHSNAELEDSTALGTITLREHQRDALIRLRGSMQEFGGALLADAVGLGKTYVALALARNYTTVHILAPATLLPMWRAAIAQTDSRNVTLHSLHRLSRAPIDVSANPSTRARENEGISATVTSGVRQSLVIVDEAHHLRTRATARYKNAVAFTANREVLLLTATPLHNRAVELRVLLALFLGQRADALDDATLARCVVRRTATHSNADNMPIVREHPSHQLPDNHMVLECLLTLPPPLPVHDGVAASALVRLGLLRAWCSSDAALTDSIRRRQMRGEALLHSLAHGRYPTQRELQSWIVGTDAVQLGFPELLVETVSSDSATLLKTLLAHLDGLQALLQLHTRTSIADARRAELLRSLVGTERLTLAAPASRAMPGASDERGPAAPPAIVAFSQFASTVRALHRALSDIAGVASLTSDGGRIASGAIARHELIASFAPRAHGRPPPPVHARIRLLITTDLLAEGVNLQDAGVVVHLDLPWTNALRQQRVGRLARMGALHAVIDVHTFDPPMGPAAALHLIALLERKAGLQRQFVGDEAPGVYDACSEQLSGADQATRLRDRWRDWSTGVCPSGAELDEPFTRMANVAFARAAVPGWIAAVAIGTEQLVVARVDHVQQTDSHPAPNSNVQKSRRASASVGTVWRAVNALQITPATAAPNDGLVERALHEVHRWSETRAAEQLTGPDARTLSPVHKRATDTLSAHFGNLPALSRSVIAPLVSTIEDQIARTRGAGAEQALEQWTARAVAQSNAGSAECVTTFTRWLRAFPYPQTRAASARDVERGRAGTRHNDHSRLIALLILKA